MLNKQEAAIQKSGLAFQVTAKSPLWDKEEVKPPCILVTDLDTVKG